MKELIQKVKENPSLENIAKLNKYIKQHPLAVCFATKSELKIIKRYT